MSAYPSVRAALLERQREFAAQPGGAVLDGRDIGTVVAPDADAKLFVTASAEVRAQRRVRELLERGLPAHYEDVLIDIRARDERDTAATSAPLRRRRTPIVLDTSELDVEKRSRRRSGWSRSASAAADLAGRAATRGLLFQ